MKRGLDILKLYIDSGVDPFFEKSAQSRKINHDTASTLKIIDNSALAALNSLAELCAAIRSFDDCAIKKTAINTVIYDGVPGSDIMLIGEAPGANEDEQGIPFCGQSGKLLDNILQSIGLNRKKNVLITNTIFWRPPGNRRPTSEEIALCRPFVEKMIAILQPKLIILVGSTAVEALLEIKSTSMSELRGKYHTYTNQYLSHFIEMTTIFHPSYLLRQPAQKKAMWFDMLKIQKRLAAI